MKVWVRAGRLIRNRALGFRADAERVVVRLVVGAWPAGWCGGMSTDASRSEGKKTKRMTEFGNRGVKFRDLC